MRDLLLGQRIRLLLGILALILLGCGLSIYLNDYQDRFRQAMAVVNVIRSDLRNIHGAIQEIRQGGNASASMRRAVSRLREHTRLLPEVDADQARMERFYQVLEPLIAELDLIRAEAEAGAVGPQRWASAANRLNAVRQMLSDLVDRYTEEAAVVAMSINIATILTFAVILAGVWSLSRHIALAQSAIKTHEQTVNHDSLTGLPNRAFLNQYLAERTGAETAVLFIDMDGFKLVNDAMGHQVGDALLVEVGRTLRDVVPPHGVLARLGGDEFVAVLSGGAPPESTALAERVIMAFQRPLQVDRCSLHLSASIGLAHAGDVGGTTTDLLRAADLALCEAKRRGKGSWVAYSPAMHIPSVGQLELGQELHRAIEAGELRLVYQPIQDLTTDLLSGFEALVRWQHPTRGLLSPGDFLPIAEAAGLLVSLDRWVLREACRQRAAWRSAFPEVPIWVSVNLSPLNFLHQDLVAYVDRVSAEISPSDLQLELVENHRLHDIYNACDVLAGRGFRLAVDDFGVGFSNLGSLLSVPISVLKLDRSLVQNAAKHPGYAAIVQGIREIALQLGLEMTAEGIENGEQLNYVRSLGIHRGQGYLLGRPLSVEESERLLHAARRM